MRLDQVRLARPYAQALSAIANTTEDLDSWFGHLECLDQIIRSPDMMDFLKNPTVSHENKQTILESAWVKFSKGLPLEVSSRLIALLVKNNRLFMLPELVDALSVLRDQRRGSYKAVVEGAYPLQDQQEAILRSWLEAETGKRVYIEYHLNPELLSGFKAQIGDQSVYASSEHLLYRLSENFRQEACF